jgi:hypothetical protein
MDWKNLQPEIVDVIAAHLSRYDLHVTHFEGYDANYQKYSGKLENHTKHKIDYSNGFFARGELENGISLVDIMLGQTKINNLTLRIPSVTRLPIQELVAQVAPLYPVEYGYSYTALLKDSPESYAIGGKTDLHCLEDVSRQDEVIVERWTSLCGAIVKGLLRDVYAKNFLGKVALQNRMKDGMSLGDWITAGHERGSLVKCTEDIQLWSVESAHLQAVRKILYQEEFVLKS